MGSVFGQFEETFQFTDGAVLDEFHGSLALTNDQRDILEREVLDESQHDDILVVRLECSDGGADAVECERALGRCYTLLGAREDFRINLVDGNRRPTRPVVVNDPVPGDVVEPAREGEADVPIRGDVLPRPQENLVGEVLGFLTTAYFNEHEPVNDRLVVVVKEAESRGLTTDGVLDYLVFAI